MNTLIPSNVAEALGWTILHSLWQASIIGAALMFLLKVMKNTQANQRYLLSLVALFSVLLVAVITFFTIYQPHSQIITSDLSEETAWFSFPTFQESEKTWDDYVSIGIDMANKYSHELSLLWLIGVAFLSIRFLINLLYVYHLKTYKIKPASIEWEARLRFIAEKIKIHRQIKLVESALVQIPTVVGWLKPVILFPLGMFTALPPHEIESILAHELAHIRRNDFIINILQSIVEILFFYHPAVWYISKQIENERENCCDDIAIALTGDSLTYIKALTNLATLKINALTPALAIIGRNGSLLQRVSRIAHNANLVNRWARQHTISPKLSASIILIMSLLLLVTKTEATTFLVEKLEKTPLEFLVKSLGSEEKQTEKENKLHLTTQPFFADTIKKARNNLKGIVIHIDSTNKANGNIFLSVKGDTLGKGFLLLSPAIAKLNIPFDKFEIDTIESKYGICTYKIKGFDSLNASWSWLHDGNNLTAVPALKKIKTQADSLGKIWLHYPNGENRLLAVNNLTRYKEFMYLPTDSIFKHLRKLKQGEDFQIYNYSDFLRSAIIDKKFWLNVDSIKYTKEGETYFYHYNQKQPLIVISGSKDEFRMESNEKSPLCMIDGEEIPQSKDVILEILSKLNSNDIDSMEVLKGKKATKQYGNKGKNGVILIKTKKGKNKKSNILENQVEEKQPQKIGLRMQNLCDYLKNSNHLLVIDGETIDEDKSNEALKKLKPNEITSIDILKGESAKIIYGERGNNGVVIISTSKTKNKPKSEDIAKGIRVIDLDPLKRGEDISIYPNPSQSYVNIRFILEKDEPVWIEAYNLNGQKIATINNGSYLNKGQNNFLWNTDNIPSGSYIITIKRGSKINQHKVVLE